MRLVKFRRLDCSSDAEYEVRINPEHVIAIEEDDRSMTCVYTTGPEAGRGPGVSWLQVAGSIDEVANKLESDND